MQVRRFTLLIWTIKHLSAHQWKAFLEALPWHRLGWLPSPQVLETARMKNAPGFTSPASLEPPHSQHHHRTTTAASERTLKKPKNKWPNTIWVHWRYNRKLQYCGDRQSIQKDASTTSFYRPLYIWQLFGFHQSKCRNMQPESITTFQFRFFA